MERPIYDEEKAKLYWEKAGLETELNKYKAIEQELGIDLITLFKAIKQGYVYTKVNILPENKQEIWKYSFNEIIICEDTGQLKLLGCGKGIMAYDYGKTWALTKGELK